MLVLRRWPGERVRVKVGTVKIFITAHHVRDGEIHLGFDAPRKDVEIEREERLKPHLEMLRERNDMPTIWGTF